MLSGFDVSTQARAWEGKVDVHVGRRVNSAGIGG